MLAERRFDEQEYTPMPTIDMAFLVFLVDYLGEIYEIRVTQIAEIESAREKFPANILTLFEERIKPYATQSFPGLDHEDPNKEVFPLNSSFHYVVLVHALLASGIPILALDLNIMRKKVQGNFRKIASTFSKGDSMNL